MDNDVRPPDFVGKLQIPAWVHKTKDGKKYIKIKLFGQVVNLFLNEPKPKEPIEEEII